MRRKGEVKRTLWRAINKIADATMDLALRMGEGGHTGYTKRMEEAGLGHYVETEGSHGHRGMQFEVTEKGKRLEALALKLVETMEELEDLADSL